MKMFKKSKRKIVASIMLILVLLLAGTFCTIYLASYRDMTEENRDLLHHYVESYVYPKMRPWNPIWSWIRMDGPRFGICILTQIHTG